MNKIVKIFILSFLLFSPFLANTAKAGMGSGPPAPCGGPFPPCPVPLDSSVWLLIAVGIIFGAKKIYDSTKKNPV